MERKLKLELPRKCMVGISVTVPMHDSGFRESIRTIVMILADIMGCELDKGVMESFDDNGRAIVSKPLLPSIAETKMESLNEAFNYAGLPIRAFLETEG